MRASQRQRTAWAILQAQQISLNSSCYSFQSVERAKIIVEASLHSCNYIFDCYRQSQCIPNVKTNFIAAKNTKTYILDHFVFPELRLEVISILNSNAKLILNISILGNWFYKLSFLLCNTCMLAIFRGADADPVVSASVSEWRKRAKKGCLTAICHTDMNAMSVNGMAFFDIAQRVLH